MTARQLIIQQIFELHFIDDAISRTALSLLRAEGVQSASSYLDLVDYSQRREIHRGRQPGHLLLDGWTPKERRLMH